MLRLLPEIDIFVLGHEKCQIDKIPSKPFLHKINLNQLELPIKNTNDLAENRFFLLKKEQFNNCKDYIGVLTSNFDTKYPNLLSLENFDQIREKLKHDTVYAASPTETFYEGKWLKYTYKYHLTIQKYIEDMAKQFHLSLEENPTLWANNFICHKSIFFKFLEFFQKVFSYMHQKYEYSYQMKVDDPSRTAAYVYERISMLYFSNRKDLKIYKIPNKKPFSLDCVNWISLASENYKILSKGCIDDLIKLGVSNENITHKNIPLPDYMKGEIRFGSDIWHHSIKNKIELIIEILKKNSTNERYDYFICHDCDVQFFPERLSVWEELFEYVDSTNYDFYFQPEIVYENYELCAGFYIIKKSRIQKAIYFLNLVLENLKNTPQEQLEFADQSVIKNLQHKTKFVLLHEKYCAFAGRFNEEYKSTYLFHHAIAAKTIAEKLSQMRKMKKLMQENKSSFLISK
jgi:hypothetical protein